MSPSGTNPAATPAGAPAAAPESVRPADTTAWTAAWELLLPAAAPPRSRGRTLQAGLRDAVRSGRLAAGTRMPPSRELAADLGVSRGLVTDAYEQLVAEGYLTAGRGSGTWVAALPTSASAARPPSGAAEPDPPGFRPGTPDLSLFPRAAWAAAQRRVFTALPHRGLGYPDPSGLPELRKALAGLLARRRGVVAAPEQVIVCSGVAQAVTLVGMVLRERGHRLAAVEDPGSPPHTMQLEATGMKTVPVPVDADGLDVAALQRSGASAAVLTPSHHFPTGVAYSPGRRGELVEWLRGGERIVVEDDYDGEFRYDREPVGALQGLDPERVAYTGSVSKSLAPGLRLGWLVVPSWLHERIAERKLRLDLGNSVLDQSVFADLLLRGDYDRHLRRCRRAYRERRDALLAALAEHFPGAEVTGIAAGLHVIATLPARYGPERAFLDRAGPAGVPVLPLAACGGRQADDGRVRLVLGYAHLSPAEIAAGVARLSAT